MFVNSGCIIFFLSYSIFFNGRRVFQYTQSHYGQNQKSFTESFLIVYLKIKLAIEKSK